MAVQNREQVGWITCPICQERASVHQCKIGRRANTDRFYHRFCKCKTVQASGAYQDYVAEHIEWLDAVKNQAKPSAGTAPAEVKTAPADVKTEPQAEFIPGEPEPEPAAKPAKRGFFAFLADEE